MRQGLSRHYWDIFQSYGAPEELSSDGGPPFTSLPFPQFLQDWAVKHRLSSAAYPQSNGRAELAVKLAKRIISGDTVAQGSLDNDRVARAILQYRNTPIQNIRLSPAQLLLHRWLCDFISVLLKGCWGRDRLALFHPLWIAWERSGQYGISHPHWVKISDETIG